MDKEALAITVLLQKQVSCFYESEVLNSSFVLLMKFSAKNSHLPVADSIKNLSAKAQAEIENANEREQL
jgi:hypothetical protein